MKLLQYVVRISDETGRGTDYGVVTGDVTDLFQMVVEKGLCVELAEEMTKWAGAAVFGSVWGPRECIVNRKKKIVTAVCRDPMRTNTAAKEPEKKPRRKKRTSYE